MQTVAPGQLCEGTLQDSCVHSCVRAPAHEVRPTFRKHPRANLAALTVRSEHLPGGRRAIGCQAERARARHFERRADRRQRALLQPSEVQLRVVPAKARGGGIPRELLTAHITVSIERSHPTPNLHTLEEGVAREHTSWQRAGLHELMLQPDRYGSARHLAL